MAETKLQKYVRVANAALDEPDETKARQLRKEAIELSKELGLPQFPERRDD